MRPSGPCAATTTTPNALMQGNPYSGVLGTLVPMTMVASMIGVIDSGITQDGAAFQDPSLTMPPGFPRANQFLDLRYTNSKVIVVRNYLFNVSPTDLFGHGTAVAMGAAGVCAIDVRADRSAVASARNTRPALM